MYLLACFLGKLSLHLPPPPPQPLDGIAVEGHILCNWSVVLGAFAANVGSEV